MSRLSETLGQASEVCAKAAFAILVAGILGSLLVGWLWIFWAIAMNYDGRLDDLSPLAWIGRVIAGSILTALAIGAMGISLALVADAVKGKR